jgi:hypothetical protein
MRTQDTSSTSFNVDLQDSPEVTEVEQSALSLPFTPLSVLKGKANVSLEGPSYEKAPDPSFTGSADIFSLRVSYHFLIHKRVWELEKVSHEPWGDRKRTWTGTHRPDCLHISVD